MRMEITVISDGMFWESVEYILRSSVLLERLYLSTWQGQKSKPHRFPRHILSTNLRLTSSRQQRVYDRKEPTSILAMSLIRT